MNGHNESRFFEKLGLIFFFLFFTGLVFTAFGIYCYSKLEIPNPTTKSLFTNSDNLLLFILLLIPFIIQIFIFLRFISKDKEFAHRNDSVDFFIKITGIIMCIGLLSYSICWLFYSLHLSNRQPLQLESLAVFSVLPLVAIFVLILIIANGTRIITQYRKRSEGLLRNTDLSLTEHKQLCQNLHTVLQNQSLIKKNDRQIEKIISKKDDENFKEDFNNLCQLVSGFNCNDLNDREIKKIFKTRIKPLIRVIRLLEENDLAHQEISENKFDIISKPTLIKILNEIIANEDFYDEELFKSYLEDDFDDEDDEFAAENSTKNKHIEDTVKQASEIFKIERKEKNSRKTIQITNRELFNIFIFRFVKESDDFRGKSPQKKDGIFQEAVKRH